MKKVSTSSSLYSDTTVKPRRETLFALRLLARVYVPLQGCLEHSGLECQALAGKAV
jgi:hypothetical protein